MLRTRVMPCLLIKDKSLVKTRQFKNERYVGDPINAVRIFNEKEVDEIIIMDISENRYDRGVQFDLIEKIASECFMPIAYGGAVRTLTDFKRLFSIGVEKVSINTSAVLDPDLITNAAARFGSQSVIVTMDVKPTRWTKRYRTWLDKGRKPTQFSPVDFAKRAEALGAGEIIVNSIQDEGTWKGFPFDLIREVAAAVNIPVIACGGAGSLDDIEKVVKESKASGVALGSMSVFQGEDLGVLIRFPTQAQLENLLNE